jgi:hypothetical protein
MKKNIIVILALLYSGYTFSQNSNDSSSSFKAGWGNLDYAVPQSPAFKLLGNSPDNILQPSSAKSIAISIGNYLLTNNNTIPKNLAVEVSPLLLNSKASLNDYNKNKGWYRMRLSLGTSIGNNGSYSVSEGIRFTIIDKTDLRSDDSFLTYLYNSAINNSESLNKALDDYALKNPKEVVNRVMCREKFANENEFRKKILSIYGATLLKSDSVSAFRDRMKQQLWNKPIWEVGAAVMQVSPDSSVNKLQMSKVGVWTTYGTHLLKNNNDQILFGARFGLSDSAMKWNTNLSLGARYYYGSNEIRGFVQGEYRYINNGNGASASVGFVFNITNGLWGQLTMSFIVDKNGKVTYSPGFNIGFGTPQDKKKS